METGKAVLGILAGFAVGAFVGILVAPEKGSVTRGKIALKGEKYANTLKEKFSDFLDNMIEKFEAVTDEVTEFSERGRMKENEIQNEVKASHR